MEKGMCWQSIYLVLVVLIGFSFSDIGFAKFLSYIKRKENWNNAQNYCRRECQGNLIHIDDITYQTLNMVVKEKNQQIWTGIFETMSGWIEILGCYNVQNIQAAQMQNFTSREITFIENNTRSLIASCSMYCGNDGHRYFALQVNLCYCFQDAIQTRLSQCNHECGSPKYKGLCGGTNQVTAFKTVNDLNGINKFSNLNCRFARCIPSSNDPSFYHGDCDLEKGWICHNIGTDDLVYTNGANNFEDSILECDKGDMYLSRFIGDVCSRVHSHDFWLGSFRNAGFQWIRDSKPVYFRNCGYISKVTMKKGNCMDQKYFICEFENLSSITTNCRNNLVLPQQNATETTIYTHSNDVNYTSETVSQEKVEQSTNPVNFTSIPSVSSGYNRTLTEQRRQAYEAKPNLISLVGSILGAIAGVIIVVFVVVFIRKRYLHNEKNTKVNKPKTENGTFTNITYDTTEKDGNNSGFENSCQLVNQSKSNTEDYEFAKCMADNDNNENSEPVYEENTEEYDHIGLPRQQYRTKDETIYDHTNCNGEDDNYDTTTTIKSAGNTSDTYDHWNMQSGQAADDLYHTT